VVKISITIGLQYDTVVKITVLTAALSVEAVVIGIFTSSLFGH
jgi:hypothetical protein